MTAPELHNKILAYLNRFPAGLTFAQIYDGVKPEVGSLDFIRQTAKAVHMLACERLISCDNLFAEPANGSAREHDLLYKVTQLGKIQLFGLILLSANEEGSSTASILDIADQGRGTAPSTESITVGKGSDGLRPHNPSLPSLSQSVISTEESRVARVMAAVDSEECSCGRPAVKVCACGKEVCAAHWYDSEGNHTLSDRDGMCSECVDAVREQVWGESRHGVTQ